MTTITKNKYAARITRDGDGWFVVSVGYNDGECFACVPGIEMKSFKTLALAERYANRSLAKC